MVVFVGILPFRRIALLVAMETMHLNATISFFTGIIFWGMPRVRMTPMETCPGVARLQGRSN